ncbi:MAG: hypothetical protein GY749_49270 [Desulfobacteraceae bacterium]|nr:hypothetical protein [Desulfobacteraceae bacterium]
MKICLKEKIGNPELFTGRKKELAIYLKWTEDIKKEISSSTALLSRRKTGKTALLQRLYNLIFHKNSDVIPFYYEIGEGKKWAVDFCKDFFMTFIWQYIAFKTRKQEYLRITTGHRLDFQKAADTARQEGMEYLIEFIYGIRSEAENENVDNLWDLTREAPLMLANHQEEFIVQIVDEFQFLNSEIYWDKAKKNHADDFAAGYMRTAEYKNAPLLVSGSWVGWLMHDLTMMLPGRFFMDELENMSRDEAGEMVFRYSHMWDIPVTEETAYMIAELSEGNPFYISSLFKSQCPDKDLASEKGLVRILEFETLDRKGIIRNTWMEYVNSAFSRVNEKYAKQIVLYLSRHRDAEVTREDLRNRLVPDMDDDKLEKKLKALVKSDIICQGQSNFDYHGVRDNIFDKVFRGVYQKEIEAFDVKEIAREYREMLKAYKKKYQELLGKMNQMKGAYAEFLIINQLKHNAYQNNDLFCSLTFNLPKDFQFAEYETVWSYHAFPIHKRELKIDIYARSGKRGYSVIGEVKNREKSKFSESEAEKFLKKIEELKELEQLGKSVGFVFSLNGFTKGAVRFMKKQGIAWSEDHRWLEGV